jgi:RHS repeat-associated protein
VTPAGAATPTVTNYLVDTTGALSHVVAETDAAGVVGAYYVRKGNDLLAVRRAPLLACFLKDGLGSVRTLADASGTVTGTKTYSAFGETLLTTGSDPQPYGFAEEAFDAVTDLSYNRARWLDPKTGTFLTYDHGILTGYTYANSDPVNLTDPSGYMTIAETAIVAGLISGGTSATLTGLGGGSPKQVVLAGLIGGVAGGTAAYVLGSIAALGAIQVVGGLTGTEVAAIGTAALSGISITGLAGLALDQSRPPAQRGFAVAATFLTVAVLVKANVNRRLTESEDTEIQALSEKYKTQIDVLGSRAQCRGRAVHSDLPVGKGAGTRSDIDFRYDGQVEIDTGGGFNPELSAVATELADLPSVRARTLRRLPLSASSLAIRGPFL